MLKIEREIKLKQTRSQDGGVYCDAGIKKVLS
jgi:hypothetical protein